MCVLASHRLYSGDPSFWTLLSLSQSEAQISSCISGLLCSFNKGPQSLHWRSGWSLEAPSSSNIIPMPGGDWILGAPALDALDLLLFWEPPLCPMCTGSAYGSSVSGWRGGRSRSTAVVPTLLSQPWTLLPVRTTVAKGYVAPDLRPLP